MALGLGHLIDAVQLLHQALLLGLRQTIEAGIAAEHPLLLLGRHAAMFVEPGAEVAGRGVGRLGHAAGTGRTRVSLALVG